MRKLIGGGVDKCGIFKAFGEVRAFCIDKTNAQLFAEVLNWKKGKDENPPIPSGDLQASRTEPKVWKTKTHLVKVHAIVGGYDCCAGKKTTDAEFKLDPTLPADEKSK